MKDCPEALQEESPSEPDGKRQTSESDNLGEAAKLIEVAEKDDNEEHPGVHNVVHDKQRLLISEEEEKEGSDSDWTYDSDEMFPECSAIET